MPRSRALIALTALIGALAFPAGSSAYVFPQIRHVFVIVEENQPASTSFAADSPAVYLSKQLPKQGAFLPKYYGIGHFSLDNYIAMLSGQAPNVVTQSDCQYFMDFPADIQGSDGQQQGGGCVYPTGVKSLVDQIDAAGMSWKSYNDSMGSDPKRESATCGHPKVNAQDNTQAATPTDQYATRHVPFLYFHSVIDDQKLCNSHVVGLGPLASDLRSVATTANFTFITPSLCNDGHDTPCVNGQPGGLKQTDTFLRKWVPLILNSPAYRNDGGMLVVTWDESSNSDTTSCCGEMPGPGSPSPGQTGAGGGRVGAVVLSPYIHGGTVVKGSYNHYSLLRSLEDLWGFGHLGYAGLPGLTSLGPDLFACAPSARPVPSGGVLPPGSEINNVRIIGRPGHRYVTLGSVGNATLTTVATQGRRQTRTSRALVPCHTFTIQLPRGRGRLTVSAASGGAAQTQTLPF